MTIKATATTVKMLGSLLALVAAGCGSSSGGPAGGGGDAGTDTASGPTAARACGDLAQVECAKRMTCSNGTNSTGASVVRVFGTMDACLTRETTACVNGLAAPQTGNSPALVEQCVAAFAGYTCADFFDNNPPAPCAATGPRAPAVACAFNGQCASGYCSGTKDASCGTCAAPPAPGDSCASSNCAHDQACIASTMMCEPHGAAGDSCDAADRCGYGSSCVGAVAATSTPGTCQASAEQLGSPCGGTMPGCDGTQGLFCGGPAGSKTCMMTAFVTDGMPCGDLSTTSHAECVAGGCYTTTGPATAGQTGTCAADASDGAPCDTVLGPGCRTPSRCVTGATGTAGTCTLPTGAACG